MELGPMSRASATPRRLALVTVAGAVIALMAAFAMAAPARVQAEPNVTLPSGTPLGLTADAGYRLVKNWDFVTKLRDEAALRAEFQTRYIYENGALDHLNDEWSRYRDEQNHVFTPAGLALVARSKGALAPGAISSGMLRSRWTGKYGVFEIRMRAPKGRGLWPAFWLNPEDKRWPPEIDVVELVNDRGPTPDRSFHFLHGAGKSRDQPLVSALDRYGAYVPKQDFSADFHVFSVEWTPTRVRHRVDGVLVADRAFRWIHDDGKDAGPAHVLVNLAVGGKWPGPPADASIFPASLVISHLRVWQQ
jgi:beta-glucanase (GH16 family)